jgi:hypothetical protein
MRPGSYLFTLLAAAVITAAGVGLASVTLARRPAPDRFVLERKLAAAVAEGRTVTLAGNVNEWMLRWNTAEQLPAAPDVAIIGSSHSLSVGAEDLGPLSAMNFSVSGSALPDHLVTTEILAARGLRPKHWVIFVDPWFFDADTDYGAWRLRSADLLRIEERLGKSLPAPPPRLFAERVAAAASPSPAARYNLDPILLNADAWLNEHLLSVHVTDRSDLSAPVIRADGARRAVPDPQMTDPEAVRELAVRQFVQKADRQRYGIYRRIDDTLWNLFAAWLRTNRADGAQVWLVLPPYHPAIHPRIKAAPDSQLEAIESRVRVLAAELGIPVSGSYDPAKAGTPAAEFYDGDHLLEPGIKRLLAPVRQQLTESAGR